MLLFFGFSLIFIFGYLVSVILVEKMQLLERLGTSFLLGFGVFTLLMFCYSSFGLRITLQSTLLALIICIVLQLALLKLFKRKITINLFGFIKSLLNFSKMEKIIIFIIAAFLVGSLTLAIYFPVNIWDALVLYDFRGKIIAQQGFYIQIVKDFIYFNGYPLFTSLSHTLVYLFGGSNPQFLYSFVYISFIFIFFSTLREFVNRRIALITSLFLASTPVIFDHSTFAYTNLPYTTFLAAGSIYLFIWFIKKKPIGYLILSAVLTGLSTWTRSSEPFWVINICILICLSVYKFKKYLFPAFVYVVSLLFIKQPWSLINSSSVSTGSSLVASEAVSYATILLRTQFDQIRISEIAIFIYKNVIVSWFPLLFLFLFCIFVNIRNIFKKTNMFFLAIIFLNFALLVFATYIFSFEFSEWKDIPDSARRMSMFFMPLMIYYIGLSLGRVFSNKKTVHQT